MSKAINKYILLFIVLIAGSTTAFSQTNTTVTTEEDRLTRILFVFDGSQSMFSRWESGSKIDIAQKLMAKMLDSLATVDNRAFEIALRVYGHQYPVPPQRCDDSKLEVPFAPGNINTIKRKLKSITPKGTTPIAYSLERAARDFPTCDNCRNIIILITDGVEACDGDPCAVSRALQKKGIALKPFVIGIGLDVEFKKTFECVGQYFDASDEKTFENVLGIVISQALNNTTAQINLLDKRGLPTETDVAMTLYDMNTGAIKYNFIHTLNHNGVPDTLILDPLITYSLTVHTIPPVSKDSIKIVPGTHNTIGINTPRGELQLSVNQRNGYNDLKCIVRKGGEMRTLNVQDFNTTEKYLVGKYDIEILTLPRYIQNDVEINQSYTTKIAIPPPGIATINLGVTGYGAIFLERGDKLEWVYNLTEGESRQNVVLQPGNYVLIFRPGASKASIYTKEKKFSISSGSTSIIKM